MAQQHRRRRSKKTNPWAGIAAIGAVLLLFLILFISLGSRDEPPAPEPATEATLPPNPFSPEDFVLDERGYMTCTAAEARLGIDVSEHQQAIDWNQVAQAGIEFAYIRVGYRGYNLGGIYEDEYLESNLQGARDAGIPIGVYFFSQAISPEEAEEEARFVLKAIDGWDISYPIVFDWEWVDQEARTGRMGSEGVTACAKAFCREIQRKGYDAGVYFNQDMAQNRMDLTELSGYAFWAAQYEDALTFPHRVDLWQYTAAGTVPGIPGNVDLNLYFP